MPRIIIIRHASGETSFLFKVEYIGILEYTGPFFHIFRGVWVSIRALTCFLTLISTDIIYCLNVQSTFE